MNRPGGAPPHTTAAPAAPPPGTAGPATAPTAGPVGADPLPSAGTVAADALAAAGPTEAGALPKPARAMPGASAEVLYELGIDALVAIIETVGYGVCITGENQGWTYVNPAGARIMGRPFEQLRDENYLLSFAEHERAALLALEHKQREGDTGFYTNTVVRPDGTELEMTWSGTVVTVGGRELAPAVFHETTSVRQAQREAAELGAAAARMAAGSSTTDVLDALVRETVAATRALGALLLVEDGRGLLRPAASTGVPDALVEAMAASPARLLDLPAGPMLARGRAGFLSDDRERLAAGVRTASWVDALDELSWEGTAKFPVWRDEHVAGVLVVVVPARVTAPSEAELAFWSSMAEQAGVALGADRMRHEISYASARVERERIARELHDSVNHALFALQTRAYLVQRALDSADADRARQAALDLEELARQATTEMRELLVELRPSADAAPLDLRQALRELAESVTTRHGLPVRVTVPKSALPALPPGTGEHLVRIAGEALHNAVKHASATAATLTLTLSPRRLELAVVDDGRGFDTAAARPGTHGQQTMRERARLCDGELRVTSVPGAGTSVVAVLPLTA
ncbi:PAS domain-containing sensor histidine kinase [Georgenia thermotolerans]|nr:PAS domain-containing sensor histidine kinase [Georgenia thermotolerans]